MALESVRFGLKSGSCGTAIHAERRIHEVSESIALMRSLDTPTRMTQAIRETLRALAAMQMREHCGGRGPDAITAVLDAMIDRSRTQSV
jgi:Domain of unknown function (DUF1932)